jgi:RNA polymerase sigma-70 factor, ECF subfamily
MLFPRLAVLRGAAVEESVRGGAQEASEAVVQESWTSMVRGIRAKEGGAMDDLYREFKGGLRLYFLRQRLDPQEMGDHIHESFLLAIRAIQSGVLREPAALPGFLMTIARRQFANHLRRVSHQRRDCVDVSEAHHLPDPRASQERVAVARQQSELMREMLEQLDPTDRELLKRFYVEEETREAICQALGITPNQFRLSKSRAKARFAVLVGRSLPRRALASLRADNRADNRRSA